MTLGKVGRGEVIDRLLQRLADRDLVVNDYVLGNGLRKGDRAHGTTVSAIDAMGRKMFIPELPEILDVHHARGVEFRPDGL